ncbi:aminodeoxychorismate synthase component I [Rhodoligotrophos defluvii]|uniref:aminodeoxychorismate synthase component I n=1 Tax=Rhodoligotrophos defluvii TaxID=2561934 RepID=UPI0010CA0219|nr:aminodeoxychorismate synthase component I [Rhodoligotrophos defluvii]
MTVAALARSAGIESRSVQPLVRPIPYRDPLTAFASFADQPMALLFDCPAVEAARSRYAYICASPFATVRAAGDRVTVTTGAEVRRCQANPWDVLANAVRPYRMVSLRDGLPPFQGGAAGLLGYELNRHLEHVPGPNGQGLACPDMAVGLYDVIAAFDCMERRAWIISSGLPARGDAERRRRAEQRADWLEGALALAEALPSLNTAARATVRAELPREDYLQRIARVKDYILAGDIYQANFTQRFMAPLPSGLAPFDLYRRLRERSRAPFSVYLNIDPDTALLSVSPERFLKLDGFGHIETRPIKGTRPRGRDATEDEALARELIASEKDRAENLMIVDLMRNDLSRVCLPGSVKVPTLFGLESFPAVHHLVSVVEGRLRPEHDAIDLLRAAFPGGSITGAPKIRAMEIIAELEVAPRGPYCGSAFWLGFSGNMDSSILIRSPVVADSQVIIQAGGGIVADSDPEEEYEESLVKARAMIEAVQITSGQPDHADLD